MRVLWGIFYFDRVSVGRGWGGGLRKIVGDIFGVEF